MVPGTSVPTETREQTGKRVNKKRGPGVSTLLFEMHCERFDHLIQGVEAKKGAQTESMKTRKRKGTLKMVVTQLKTFLGRPKNNSNVN